MSDFLNAKVYVREGALQGYAEDELLVFKGVPYASAPTCDLRFQPPVAKEPWIGIRPAREFGAKSVQPMVRDKEFRLSDQSFCDEDCLFLNIYSPAIKEDDKLPVFVWIHGGAFNTGAGSHLLYHAEYFARESGIIVVTINYRLGLLGFFAHPELTAQSEHRASGNYALMDQLFAVNWIKKNIATFGGDPENITIGGQSAGAMSVNALLASPLSKESFQRATVQSGPMFYPIGSVPPLAEMERRGVRFLEKNNLTLEQLMRLPAIEVMELDFKFDESFSPCVDGWFLKETPRDAAIHGNCCPVALLIGSTSDEFGAHPEGIPVENYLNFVKGRYGEFADRILALYPAKNERQAAKSYVRLSADLIHKGSVEQARSFVKSGQRAYAYYFSHPVKCEDADIHGAPHNAELPYLFHRVGLGGPMPWFHMEWDEYDHTMSKMVMGYWANFAKNGNPNGEGLPKWDSLTEDEILEFGSSIGMMERTEMQKKFALIDEMERAGISLSTRPGDAI